MNGLIGTVGSLVDRRRLMATWLPVFAFCLAIGAVVVAARGWRSTTDWWTGLGVAAQATLIGAFVVGSVLVAQLLAARSISLLRLYEGHWPAFPGSDWITGHLAVPHLAQQRRRTAEAPDLFLTYPRRAQDVLPTRLGNILRAAEQHSQRYGIADAVTVWPRLYVALPGSFTDTFAAAAASLEVAVTISFLGIVFAVAGGALGAVMLPWYGAMLCVWAGVLTAYLGYWAAVRAALPYAQLIRTAFDVHRFALLEAMHLELPTGFGAEREQWEQLGKVWYHGGPDPHRAHLLRYPKAEPPDPPPPGPARTVPAAPVPIEAAPLSAAPDLVAKRWRVSLVIVAALVGSVAAAGVAALRADARADALDGDGLVAARVLPAYHVIEAGDARRRAGSRSATALDGRYTLRPVAAGAALRDRDLGPVLPHALTGLQIVTVPVADTRLAGRGQVVRLLVVGPAAAATTPLRVDDVVVLDVPGGTAATLVVAVSPNGVTQLMQAAAGGTVHLVVG